MSSQLYIGNGQAAPAVIVEKPTPMPYSIVLNNNNGVLESPSSIMDFSNITDIKVSLSGLYAKNNNISGHIDLSSLRQLSWDPSDEYNHYQNGVCTGMFERCRNITSVDLGNLETVSGRNACNGMFECCSGITSIDMHSLKTISGQYGCRAMFYMCGNKLSGALDLSSLETISGNNACTNMFDYNTKITSVDLSSLTTISGNYACQAMFYRCYNLETINLDNLVTVSGQYSMQNMFSENKMKSLVFTKLCNIDGTMIFSYLFYNCTLLETVSFPALTSKSFGNKSNQFSQMLYGCTNVTLHFPSNLESKIQTLTGYPNFSGTNTVLLYDLPATE